MKTTGMNRVFVLLWSVLLSGCMPISAERHQTPTPAGEAVQETIAAVMAGSQPTTETFPSPDGQWQAEIIVYGCTTTGDEEHAYELLRLAASGAAEWQQVDSQLINCGGLGAFGLAGLCWSPDSRYFYYTPAREGVPDGAGEWTRPVRQLAAAAGAISEVEDIATAASGGKTLCTSAQP